jgi:drug/metabolite transporter (DMT)-like permease
LVLVQVFFGIHYVVAKVILREIEPQALALIRVSGAALLLLAATRLAGRRLPRGRALLWLAALSVLGSAKE